MSKKIWISMTAIVVTLVGLLTWTFSIKNDSISIGGSASVDPILQQFTSAYKDAEFVYSSTGSGNGVANVKSGIYDIGFISKEVSSSDFPPDTINKEDEYIYQKEDASFDQAWVGMKDEIGKYRSVEFATDAIVFVYNIDGLNFTKELQELFAFKLKESTSSKSNDDKGKLDPSSKEIVKMIYDVDNQSDLVTWDKIAIKLVENSEQEINKIKGPGYYNSLLEQAKKVKPLQVTPYTTQPGSGTRSSFVDLTGVTPGQAANVYNNNGGIFSQLSRSQGSIGFMSMNYAFEIKKDPSKYGNLKTVIVDGMDILNLKEDQKWQDYKLTRPFIGIYKIYDDKEKMKRIWDFMHWIVTNQELELTYEKLGLIRITADNLPKTI